MEAAGAERTADLVLGDRPREGILGPPAGRDRRLGRLPELGVER
jgi:hypothetical protein